MTLVAAAEASDLDADLPARPYPGLRPFEKAEWPIFFGRERMTEELIARLIGQHLVVVHGDSGCGKSSLIYAGVLPRLEQEAARGSSVWLTCAALPGEKPLWNLAEALSGLRGDVDEARTLTLRRLLNFGRDGAKEVAKLLRRNPNEHLCILIDQFEELFAHAKRSGSNDARLLIEFLIGIKEARLEGVYAIVTMRSEFLGACAKFADFAEAVNATQYLLPRMERPDLVRAIREPATLFDGQISRELAERLIDDAAGSQDQLPLIQHGLMLLYQKHLLQPGGAGKAWKLGLEHYDTKGGNLASLLSAHADEVAKAVDPGALEDRGQSRVVEDLFRSLTDINAEGQAIRRPQTLGELILVNQAGEGAVRSALDAFRAEGVSLLRPYGSKPLELDDRVDISHEALIRCWKRIAELDDGWLIREFKNGLVWRSLLVQADSFERDASNVLSAATTAQRAKWMLRRSAAWCERFGGGWDRVRRLIDASVAAVEQAEEANLKARKAAEESRLHQLELELASQRAADESLQQRREIEQQKRAARNLRIGISLILLLAAVALVLASVAFTARHRAEVALRQLQKASEAERSATQKAVDSARAAASAQAQAAQAVQGRAVAEADAEKSQLAVAKAADALAGANDRLSAVSGSAAMDGKARQALQAAQAAIAEQADALSVATVKSHLPARIYFQISEERQRAAAQRLVEQMSKIKVGDARLSMIAPVGIQRSHVDALRCFRHDECDEARGLLAVVNARLASPKLVLQDFTAQFEHSTNMRARHYEIWFQAGEIRLTQ